MGVASVNTSAESYKQTDTVPPQFRHGSQHGWEHEEVYARCGRAVSEIYARYERAMSEIGADVGELWT